ncbi:MAG: response regulator transcription factor [Candidatus Nanopelagicaceae bacterium]
MTPVGGVVTQSLFRKAQGLVELLGQDPLRAQVISYLSRELSPESEPCAVAFLQLSRDGLLHVVMHEGFAHFDPMTVTDLDINSDRAVSIAFRDARVRIYSESEFRGFPTVLPKDLKTYWNSAAAIPIGLQSMYFINFRDDVTTYSDYEDFIHCIGSLLTSFEWEFNARLGKKQDLWFDEKSLSLTEREERIVELIRLGKTNYEISKEMGYSESLIRQETVTIYRKLGVTGRKEIMKKDATPKRAVKNAIRVAIALAGIETLDPLLHMIDSMNRLIY